MARNAEQAEQGLKRRSPGGQARASGNESNDQERNVMSDISTAVSNVIPVFSGSMLGREAFLVEARELHRFLEVDTHFKDWVVRRIAEYGFQEGEDFCSFLSKSSGGRPSREYHITLDMAKELAMVERNEKGKQARRYFIECEKRLIQVAPNDAATIMNQTIGTDGFHMLGSLVKGKVSSLPSHSQRRATMKIWSQVHSAFGVRCAADIPADQLDSARNFIAAYAVTGEWIGQAKQGDHVLTDKEMYDVGFLLGHFLHIKRIYDQWNLGSALRMLGSPIGAEMIDHFQDGMMAVYTLRKRAVDMEAAAIRLGLKSGKAQGGAV